MALDRDASKLLFNAMMYGEPSDFSNLFAGARKCEESLRADEEDDE